ncbi:MAG TPA: hypothetical protein VH165_14275 [Kofleriaceae bacterium]|nr:hypothetical protein [Kofleriaceae bacterium]
MKAISAHVRNGQIVPDDPIQLREGDALEVVLLEDDEMSAEEMAELDDALDESRAQFERGEFEDARAFVLRLAAKS